LLSRILRPDVTTGGLASLFYLTFLGAGSSLLLRQDYGGRLPKIARQPVVVAVVLTPLAMVPLFLSVTSRMAHLGLSSLGYAMTLAEARVLPVLLESLAAGVVIQLIYLVVPRLRPVQAARRSAPYGHSLNRQFLTLVVPLVLVATAVLMTAVTATTIRAARAQAIQEMAQDAYSAAEAIPQFIHTGQALLMAFAGDERLQQDDTTAVQSRLIQDLRMGPFFDQLLLFDRDRQLLTIYPPAPTGDPQLTAKEESLMERVLRDGTFQISPAHRSSRGKALVSFLAPVGAAEGDVGGRPFGALVGRTHLDVNPLMTRILTGLQWTSGLSEGLLIDRQGRIIAHPDNRMLLTDWQMGEDRNCTTQPPRGQFCVSRDPARQSLQLTYYVATDGYPWTVVIRLPYEVVLDEAREIAKPLLILQALFGVGLVLGIWSVTRRLTQPLERLAGVADRVAGGDLTDPVEVTGEDAVGRGDDADGRFQHLAAGGEAGALEKG
jgi:HAMP domain-containing protein